MKKSDAFLFNQCFVVLAFVLSLNGLEKIGIVFAIFSILYACKSLNKNVIKNDWLMIFSVSFIELCVFEIAGLNRMYTSLYFESLSSLIVSFIWSHSGYKARSYGMKWMSVAGFLFLIASLISPIQRFSNIISLLVSLSIFFPSIILHSLKQYRFYKKTMHRNVNMTVVK